MTARITRLDIEGLRSIDKLSLDLHPMNVLIGENGSGKTTVLEAMELLRKAAVLPDDQFVSDIYNFHGGVQLFRNLRAPRSLRSAALGVVVTGSDFECRYRLELSANRDTGSIRMVAEQLFERRAASEWLLAERSDQTWHTYTDPDDDGHQGLVPFNGSRTSTLLGAAVDEVWGDRAKAVREVLKSSQIYAAFESNPAWARSPKESASLMRLPVQIRPASSLDRSGENLPNAFHELRNRGAETWTRVIETLQLGLGHDLIDVRTEPSPSGGTIGLALTWKSVGAVPAFALSDGQLAFLAFVAISELEADRDGVVGFDEPDLHQHPAMIGRTVALCERLSERRTVVIATHSDRLLDALSEPADAVVLFERDGDGATIVRRPSRPWLDKWLADYSGLGGARAEGYGGVIFTEPAEAPSS